LNLAEDPSTTPYLFVFPKKNKSNSANPTKSKKILPILIEIEKYDAVGFIKLKA
jgi:hypothetical protein